MSKLNYRTLIKGRSGGTLYVTWNTYINELPLRFVKECKIRNITIKIVDRCDRRRNTFEVQQNDKRNQS
jgi:hypothetical protein